MKRGAFCGWRFGLISYRKGRLRFCKQVHKSTYFQQQREQQKIEDRRQFNFLQYRISQTPTA
jgi:hypothetical protein